MLHHHLLLLRTTIKGLSLLLLVLLLILHELLWAIAHEPTWLVWRIWILSILLLDILKVHKLLSHHVLHINHLLILTWLLPKPLLLILKIILELHWIHAHLLEVLESHVLLHLLHLLHVLHVLKGLLLLLLSRNEVLGPVWLLEHWRLLRHYWRGDSLWRCLLTYPILLNCESYDVYRHLSLLLRWQCLW